MAQRNKTVTSPTRTRKQATKKAEASVKPVPVYPPLKMQPEYIFLFTVVFAILGSLSLYNYARTDRLTKQVQEIRKTLDAEKTSVFTAPDCVLHFGERAGDESIEL
jgi:hypothetical protein